MGNVSWNYAWRLFSELKEDRTSRIYLAASNTRDYWPTEVAIAKLANDFMRSLGNKQYRWPEFVKPKELELVPVDDPKRVRNIQYLSKL